MRNAMKKFVAVVLTLAMLLGMATTAFASGVPIPIGRDLTEPITLRVWHMTEPASDIFNPPVTPGDWISPGGTPPPIPAAVAAQNAYWHAIRLEAPAGWTGLMPPQNVINAIQAGTLPALPATGPSATGWYRSSVVMRQNTGTTGVAVFAPGAAAPLPAHVPGLPGVFANITFQSAVQDFNFVAPNEANARNPMGQGLWFVWEVTSPFQVANEDVGLADPFLVNLPHFIHHPDGGHFNEVNQPGEWIYVVNVYVKPEEPPPFGKTYLGTLPLERLVPRGAANVPVYRHISILDWEITVGILDGLDVMNPVNFPVGQASPDPGPLPGMIVSGLGNAAPGGRITTGDTFILIRDILDYRVRVLDFDPALATGVARSIEYAFEVTFETGAPVAGVAPTTTLPRGADGSRNWYVRSVIIPAGTTPLTLEAATTGGVVPTFGPTVWGTPNSIGSRIPANQWSTYPAALTAAATLENDIQIFWFHLTNAGRQFVAATGYTGGNLIGAGPATTDPGNIRINFSVYAEWSVDLSTDDLGNIVNDATLNYGNDPEIDVPTDPDDRTSQQRGFRIHKQDAHNNWLDGAVFYLWPQSAVRYRLVGTGAAPNTFHLPGAETSVPGVFYPATPPAPAAGQSWVPELIAQTPPIRRAVSGGAALAYTAFNTQAAAQPGGIGNWPVVPPVAFTPYTGPAQNIPACSSLPHPHAGIAMFTGLNPGVYYLFERIAPAGGYRRVTNLLRVDIEPSLVPGAPVYVTYRVDNAREFELPLTGGAGTIMFTAAGVSLMGGAGLFLFLSRKKEKAEK